MAGEQRAEHLACRPGRAGEDVAHVGGQRRQRPAHLGGVERGDAREVGEVRQLSRDRTLPRFFALEFLQERRRRIPRLDGVQDVAGPRFHE